MEHLLTATPEISSAGVVIVSEQNRYLMQLRDDLPHVSFGGWWGLFGGAIEPGETPEEAARREVAEEIGLRVGAMSFLTSLAWDLRRQGLGIRLRHYFVTRCDEAVLEPLPVLEGAGKALMTYDAWMREPKALPLDLFALTLHERQTHRNTNGHKG